MGDNTGKKCREEFLHQSAWWLLLSRAISLESGWDTWKVFWSNWKHSSPWPTRWFTKVCFLLLIFMVFCTWALQLMGQVNVKWGDDWCVWSIWGRKRRSVGLQSPRALTLKVARKTRVIKRPTWWFRKVCAVVRWWASLLYQEAVVCSILLIFMIKYSHLAFVKLQSDVLMEEEQSWLLWASESRF